jgi:hypothetical protein
MAMAMEAMAEQSPVIVLTPDDARKEEEEYVLRPDDWRDPRHLTRWPRDRLRDIYTSWPAERTLGIRDYRFGAGGGVLVPLPVSPGAVAWPVDAADSLCHFASVDQPFDLIASYSAERHRPYIVSNLGPEGLEVFCRPLAPELQAYLRTLRATHNWEAPALRQSLMRRDPSGEAYRQASSVPTGAQRAAPSGTSGASAA